MKTRLSALQLFLIFIITLLVVYALMPGVITSLPAGDDGSLYGRYLLHTDPQRYSNALFHAIIAAVVVTLTVFLITAYMNAYEPLDLAKPAPLMPPAPPMVPVRTRLA
jgi:ABC-type spermidine/putrescine transport system permease subunit I